MKGGNHLKLVLFALLGARTPSLDAEESVVPPPIAAAQCDCGTACLYMFLRAHGLDVDVADVVDALPGRPSRGYSLKQLRDAGRRLGLSITGVEVDRARPSIDRPFLAHLKGDEHGHFVLIRVAEAPGHCLVIDGNGDEIRREAASTLAAMPGWTGVGLIRTPAPPAPFATRSIVLFGLIAGGFALLFRAKPRRGPRAGRHRSSRAGS